MASPRPYHVLLLALILLPPLSPLAWARPAGCVGAQTWDTQTHAWTDVSCTGVVSTLPVLPGMRASCYEQEIEPQAGPGCCDHDASCCKDVACCGTDVVCIIQELLGYVRERIGQEAAGHGVCLDVGQDNDGMPYANVNPTRGCTQPPPSS